jgi:hypothetical protein
MIKKGIFKGDNLDCIACHFPPGWVRVALKVQLEGVRVATLVGVRSHVI